MTGVIEELILIWLNLVMSAWLLVSPWLLGFSTNGALTWNAVISGLLVAMLAGLALYEEQGRKQMTK